MTLENNGSFIAKTERINIDNSLEDIKSYTNNKLEDVMKYYNENSESGSTITCLTQHPSPRGVPYNVTLPEGTRQNAIVPVHQHSNFLTRTKSVNDINQYNEKAYEFIQKEHSIKRTKQFALRPSYSTPKLAKLTSIELRRPLVSSHLSNKTRITLASDDNIPDSTNNTDGSSNKKSLPLKKNAHDKKIGNIPRYSANIRRYLGNRTNMFSKNEKVLTA